MPAGGPAAMTLWEFFDRRYRPDRLVGRKPASIEQYRIALEHLRRAAGGDPPLAAFARPPGQDGPAGDELIALTMQRVLDRGDSRATANKVRAHLLAVWRYACQLELVDRLPRVGKIREFRRSPRAYLVGDVTRLLEAAESEDWSIEGIPARYWWQALLLLLYDTGLRITAALSLEWAQYDADSLAIVVAAETQKHGSDQYLAVSRQTGDAIARTGGARRWLFPWPYDLGTASWPILGKHFARIAGRAGVKLSRGKKFHPFRASTASYLERQGGNATLQLGHSTRQVTERSYLDPRIVKPPRQVDLLPRPSLPSPFRVVGAG